MSIINLYNPDRKYSNIIKNPLFDYWTAGTSVAPDNWTWTPGASSTIARESTTILLGLYSANISENLAGVSSTLKQSLITNDLPLAYWKGKTIRASIWVYTAQANGVRIETDDGVAVNISSYHTGGGGWEEIILTTLIDSSATKLDFLIRFQNAAGTYTTYIDGCVVCELSSNSMIIPVTEPDGIVMRKSATGNNQASKIIRLISDVAGSDKYTDIYRDGTNDGLEIKNDAGNVITQILDTGSIIIKDNAGNILYKVYADGTIDTPLQPSALVIMSATQIIANGTWTKLNLDTEKFDKNSDFDTTNKRFIAPVDGVYFVKGQATWSTSISVGVAININIYKNGFGEIYETIYSPTTAAWHTMRCSGLLSLAATDYVELWVNQGSGGNQTILNVTSYTHFDIIKVT